MFRRKNKLFLICAMIIAVLLGIISYLSLEPTTAYATSSVLYDSDYTDNDNLCNLDGSVSSKTIKDFANEVKAASNATSFPEITKVIPAQYLESTETNATYSYNGKEYGFYVAKEDDYFDVLLIDFVYEFADGAEHSDLEYKIQIKPLLQQSFIRISTSDGYIWQKRTDSARYKYYVANPRFLSVVQNENALNYGDDGYSKYNDDGVIKSD